MNTFKTILIQLINVILINCIKTQNVEYTPVYKGDFYKITDMHIPGYGRYRTYSPNDLLRDGIIHGMISLDNINHIQSGYIKLLMGSLYLLPTKSSKRILFIGLGVGVLPKTLDQILPNSQIDVVEIEQISYDLAKQYFFYNTSDRVKVHIADGYDYVMNLPKEKSYDIIVLDAFLDLSQEVCAPYVFLNDKFVLKVKEKLKPNGVYAINTVPPYCSHVTYEIGLYHKYFGRLYMGKHFGNRIVLAQKGKQATQRQIKNRVKYYREAFNLVGTDSNWIVETFKSFQKQQYYMPRPRTCQLDASFFINNTCFF